MQHAHGRATISVCCGGLVAGELRHQAFLAWRSLKPSARGRHSQSLPGPTPVKKSVYRQICCCRPRTRGKVFTGLFVHSLRCSSAQQATRPGGKSTSVRWQERVDLSLYDLYARGAILHVYLGPATYTGLKCRYFRGLLERLRASSSCGPCRRTRRHSLSLRVGLPATLTATTSLCVHHKRKSRMVWLRR